MRYQTALHPDTRALGLEPRLPPSEGYNGFRARCSAIELRPNILLPISDLTTSICLPFPPFTALTLFAGELADFQTINFYLYERSQDV